jgi:uncharacterized phage-like protein YoqJ
MGKKEAQSSSLKMSEFSIPARIIIGVAGHRILQNEPELIKQIHLIFSKIKERISPLKNTTVEFVVLSSLAEGAGRLVAREVLKMPDAQLEVVLSFEAEEYLEDFKQTASQEEFEDLLSKANHIKTLPASSDRKDSYSQANRYIVDHCDVFIVIWNGKEASESEEITGTAQYARRKKCPLFWIDAENIGRIKYEPGHGLNVRSIQDLDRYNSEKIKIKKIKKDVEQQKQNLLSQAEKAKFESRSLQEISDKLLPHFVRADLLAQRFRTFYFKAGIWVYSLAVAAVAAATFQIIFLPEWPKIILFEVAFIFFALLVYWLGSRRKWHAKYIDYRFLAERFRSALFMAAANVNVSALRPSHFLGLSYSPQDWMVAAFYSIWSQLPRGKNPNSSGLRGLKEFLIRAWINDQILFHKRYSRKNHRRYRRMLYTGNTFFGLTFIMAIIHVFHLGPYFFNHILAFTVIVFPAIAGAIAAIRTHREYLRNAKRSNEMVRHLEELKYEMVHAEDLKNFLPLVREAEETMLHENEDWRVIVRFHELEPPA